jgi:hypothetical protein
MLHFFICLFIQQMLTILTIAENIQNVKNVRNAEKNFNCLSIKSWTHTFFILKIKFRTLIFLFAWWEVSYSDVISSKGLPTHSSYKEWSGLKIVKWMLYERKHELQELVGDEMKKHYWKSWWVRKDRNVPQKNIVDKWAYDALIHLQALNGKLVSLYNS